MLFDALAATSFYLLIPIMLLDEPGLAPLFCRTIHALITYVISPLPFIEVGLFLLVWIELLH